MTAGQTIRGPPIMSPESSPWEEQLLKKVRLETRSIDSQVWGGKGQGGVHTHAGDVSLG
jgi:hypothetical protein